MRSSALHTRDTKKSWSSLPAVYRVLKLYHLSNCFMLHRPGGGSLSSPNEITLRVSSAKAKRFGFCNPTLPTSPTQFAELCSAAEKKLIKRVLANKNHVLHNLLPSKTNLPYNLRPRRHDREQPVRVSRLIDANFVERSLADNKC